MKVTTYTPAAAPGTFPALFQHNATGDIYLVLQLNPAPPMPGLPPLPVLKFRMVLLKKGPGNNPRAGFMDISDLDGYTRYPGTVTLENE